MQTDGLKHIKWLSSHRQAYGFSPRIYNSRKHNELNTNILFVFKIKNNLSLLFNIDVYNQ